MSGNTFGSLFRVTTFGESHGAMLGAVIDGCPPRLALSEEDIQPDLDRRRPGATALSSPRKERDRVKIVSGVYQGLTTGTPLTLVFVNEDARSEDYKEFASTYRPSHADYTYDAKYGHRAVAGGGRASARETAARVAAGAVAKKLLKTQLGVEIVSWVQSVAELDASVAPEEVTAQAVESSGPLRCPDRDVYARMEACIEAAQAAGDTVGGVIGCVVRGVPAGLGNPVFDKLEARLGMAMLSLPAAKGFEVGSGFEGTRLRGSEHNDPFHLGEQGQVVTTSNHSGGVQGGISNGMPIVFRVAFKPVSTLFMPQQSVDTEGREVTMQGRGRHDPCVLPRAVPIVEAMAALTLCDAWLQHRGQVGTPGP